MQQMETNRRGASRDWWADEKTGVLIVCVCVEGGAHSSAHCVWLLCNYCRISVSTVLLHYMKDSYLLCLERAFYLSLKLSGIKKNI